MAKALAKLHGHSREQKRLEALKVDKMRALFELLEDKRALSLLRRLQRWMVFTQEKRQAELDLLYLQKICQQYDKVEKILTKRQTELCFHRIKAESQRK